MLPETRANYEWLVTDEAAALLSVAVQAMEDRTGVLTIVKRLRQDTTAPRSALIMELAQLRLRGRRKFSLAAQMFFTRRGYEQSTSESIAHYKSFRFGGQYRVADICTGIGGDLIGIASRPRGKETVGFEPDELCFRFARANSKVYDLPATRVLPHSFAEADLSGFDAIHIDPDRRQGGRTVQAENFAPGLEEIESRLDDVKNWAIKVAPATTWPEALRRKGWREWIGSPRECKQQVLWLGEFAEYPGGRAATVVAPSGEVQTYRNPTGGTLPVVEIAPTIRQYLYEPHPTILAAELTDHLGAEWELERISPGVAYLLSDRRLSIPLSQTFEILEVLPYNFRRVGTRLREMKIGQLEIKTRGLQPGESDRFFKMRLVGDESAVLILTRHQRQRKVLIARRPTVETEPG